MSLEVVPFDTVQLGLRELLETAYPMSQNLRQRVETPTLEDGTNLWDTFLDSKTIQLYGGVNEDKRHRFKIDHSFDLAAIVNEDILSDGSISIDEEIYNKSQGTEFIVISKSDIKGAKVEYAIRADKYKSIREQLNKGNYSVTDLEKAGGFKVSEWLTPDEAKKSDGWLEFFVGKNKSSKEDYEQASNFLSSYVTEAENQNCFPDGTGMGFFVNIEEEGYKARPWCVDDSSNRSDASGRDFNGYGRFLRVPKVSAEGGAQKILDTYRAGNTAEALRLLDLRTANDFLNLATAWYNQQKQ